jgi:hypothetical protein
MVDHLEMRKAFSRAQQPFTAPDSGGWSHINQAWIEATNDLYLTNEDFQVRKQGSFKITVDGFPRQGNRYLRRKILLALPHTAMPFPLCHKEVASKEAIADKNFIFSDDHFIFSTFRDPLKSVSSYISEFINHTNINGILNPLKDFIYTEDDYFYINKCFLFYIRMTDFIYNNINDIFVVPFESIAGDKNNSLISTIANLLPTTKYVEAHQVEPHSSKDMKMQDYLMTDKFHDIMQLANQSYNRVLDLSSTNKDRFVLL